jgi:hypothetical protein
LQHVQDPKTICSSGLELDPEPCGRARQGPGRWPLEQHFAPEAVELGRPPSCAHPDLAGRLDETCTLDEPAEVLLVQMRAEDCLHGLLQLFHARGKADPDKIINAKTIGRDNAYVFFFQKALGETH